MQRNVVYCDGCQASDLEPGYAVLSVSGDRSTAIKSRIPGGRNTLDLCDACAVALGAFLADLGKPKEVEAEAIQPVESEAPPLSPSPEPNA